MRDLLRALFRRGLEIENVQGKSSDTACARRETRVVAKRVVRVVRRRRGTRNERNDVLRDGFVRVVAIPRGDEIRCLVQEAEFEVLVE